jgi:hypothetical protein
MSSTILLSFGSVGIGGGGAAAADDEASGADVASQRIAGLSACKLPANRMQHATYLGAIGRAREAARRTEDERD